MVVLVAVVRRNTQINAKERKRAQLQVRKRAQKGHKRAQRRAKERFHAKIANNQVETTRVGNSQDNNGKNDEQWPKKSPMAIGGN